MTGYLIELQSKFSSQVSLVWLINFTVIHYSDWIKMMMMTTTMMMMMMMTSLRNRTAERRGRQNAGVWQTWRDYYLRVLLWSSLKLMFSALLHKGLFKGGWSSAKPFFKQSYCHACHTRFAVFFPLQSRCVSSLITFEEGGATSPSKHTPYLTLKLTMFFWLTASTQTAFSIAPL